MGWTLTLIWERIIVILITIERQTLVMRVPDIASMRIRRCNNKTIMLKIRWLRRLRWRTTRTRQRIGQTQCKLYLRLLINSWTWDKIVRIREGKHLLHLRLRKRVFGILEVNEMQALIVKPRRGTLVQIARPRKEMQALIIRWKKICHFTFKNNWKKKTKKFLKRKANYRSNSK